MRRKMAVSPVSSRQTRRSLLRRRFRPRRNVRRKSGSQIEMIASSTSSSVSTFTQELPMLAITGPISTPIEVLMRRQATLSGSRPRSTHGWSTMIAESAIGSSRSSKHAPSETSRRQTRAPISAAWATRTVPLATCSSMSADRRSLSRLSWQRIRSRRRRPPARRSNTMKRRRNTSI